VSANRTAFLLQSLADLRAGLGGALAVRRGDPVREIKAVSAPAPSTSPRT
jgi:hypothetical protein